MRSPAETPTRQQALSLYTQGSAWLAHAQNERGQLAAGRLADIVVLSEDYFQVDVPEIGRIHSLLTLLGNQVVYAESDYADLWKH